jgi:hypothetical protein
MPANTPQSAVYEFFFMVFGIFGLPPSRFLTVGNYFEKERAGEESERCIVTHPKRRMETGGQNVALSMTI